MTFDLYRGGSRLCALLALVTQGIAALNPAAAGAQGLQPPIDGKSWMVPSPSQPLRVLKAPSFGPGYPNLKDYMRVLERFPLLGERGWRANYLGDKNLGFFGDPDSAEMGLRAMGNYIFVMSLLASDLAYDESVTGISRRDVLKRARQCLDYMTRSHVTGDITCGDGKKWGDHWQSAWWTAKMALGARLIWDRLSLEQRQRVERVVVHEASRHLTRKAPGGAFRDTKSEENAWDTEVMAAAIALFPDHPQAAGWRAKLIEFGLNSLSTLQDQTSSRVVDGRPLKEQVYTENVHYDYTIENHGAYHTCYMSCPLHSLAWGYYALSAAKQPVPEAQFHHFVDVWERMKPTFLDRRFAYVEGKDWPRYAYGMYFIMPALVTLQQRFGDAAAREIEKRRFQTFEEEQYSNADGTFFGKRFTLNQMMHRLSEYETDCYANLAVCYLLHKEQGGEPLKPPSPREFAAMLSRGYVSVPSEFATVRSDRLFASFAWKMLSGAYPAAFFIPSGMDDAAEWGPNNLTGRIEVRGMDPKKTRVEHSERLDESGFRTAGRLIYFTASNSRPAYSQQIEFAVNTARRTALIETRFTAHQPIEVTAIEGLRLLVQSDIFNGGRRRYFSDEGTKLITFDLNAAQPEKETITNVRVGDGWVNIDNRLGIVRLSGSDPFVLRQSNRRNAPWGSIHYDALDCPAPESVPRSFAPGQEILRTRFLLIAGDSKRTARAASDWRRGIRTEEEMIRNQMQPNVQELIKKSFDRPLVAGHRGAADRAPENTLEAFRVGMASGAAAVECDVHMTKDGVPVVIHDGTLDRTTPLKGRVADHTAAEVRAAGVPTLDELTDLTRGQIALIIELKDGAGLEEAVADIVKRKDMANEVIIFSFSDERVRKMRDLLPSTYSLLLIGAQAKDQKPQDLAARMEAAKADALGIAYSAITADLAKHLRARGTALFAWTVPPGADAEAIRDLGVNVIITNDPQAIVEMLAE